MKNILAPAILLALLSFSANVHATVALYGIVDMGFMHRRGGDAAGTVKALNSGLQSPSRIGFRGEEDLGGGLSAIFAVEQGLLADTGTADQGGLPFGRQTFVGLKGHLGTLKLGRQYTPLYNATVSFDPFEAAVAGDYTRLVAVGGPAGRRVDNAVTYALEKNGLKAEFLHGFGEQAGNGAALRQSGWNLSYARNGFLLSWAGHRANDAGASHAVRNTAFGAGYRIEAVKLSGLYQVNRDGASLDTRDYLAGIAFTLGRGTVMASFIRHDDRAAADADSRQVSLGGKYPLSARTNLYVGHARLANGRNARLHTTQPGGSLHVFVAGIRHLF